MKKSMLVFLFLSAFVTTSIPTISKSDDMACEMVMCLYGEKNGSGGGGACKSALSEYKKIKKTKKHSDHIKCAETKAKRLAKLLTCKQNEYDVNELVDCDE